MLLLPEGGEKHHVTLGMTAEGHSASSSSSSFVTAELNSDTGVWGVTYSVSHAVQRTPVSKISQVWLPQLQVYRSAIKYLLQEGDALHHHQSRPKSRPTTRERPAMPPARARGCASIPLTVDDGQTVGDLERHTSPFEVELTIRLMGGATEHRGQMQEFLFAAAVLRRAVSSRCSLVKNYTHFQFRCRDACHYAV